MYNTLTTEATFDCVELGYPFVVISENRGRIYVKVAPYLWENEIHNAILVMNGNGELDIDTYDIAADTPVFC